MRKSWIPNRATQAGARLKFPIAPPAAEARARRTKFMSKFQKTIIIQSEIGKTTGIA
jgi:hypothetical protein